MTPLISSVICRLQVRQQVRQLFAQPIICFGLLGGLLGEGLVASPLAGAYPVEAIASYVTPTQHPIPIQHPSSKQALTQHKKLKPQTTLPSNRHKNLTSSFDFSGDGRSGRRIGGGSRSDCPAVETPLTAIMPQSNTGLTVSEQPSIWLYVPFSPQQATSGEFILQDAARNDLYRTQVRLPKTPGFTYLTLPAALPKLSPEQAYRWYFHLYCNAEKSSSPVFVQGWIERRLPSQSLQQQLTDPERLEAEIYADHGIWFDAIASLAEQLATHPQSSELRQAWKNLLTAKGVDLALPNSLPFTGSIILNPEAPASKR